MYAIPTYSLSLDQLHRLRAVLLKLIIIIICFCHLLQGKRRSMRQLTGDRNRKTDNKDADNWITTDTHDKTIVRNNGNRSG